MTSDTQRQANRRNAQKSTGPTTPEGKENSRLNALKHGGYLSHCDHVSATILCENEDEIEELRDAIVADLAPQTVLETMQARAVAQKILNQYRIDRLGPYLASAEELAPLDGRTPDEHDRAREFWEQVIHTITQRSEPAVPDLLYDEIAKLFYDLNKKRLGPIPPVINPDLVGDDIVDAWRDQLCEMADRVYSDQGEACHKILTLRQKHARAADRMRREIAGSEARRLIDAFSKITDLQDRVGRMIARDLKAYRDLQTSQPRPDNDNHDSRNEPNPTI